MIRENIDNGQADVSASPAADGFAGGSNGVFAIDAKTRMAAANDQELQEGNDGASSMSNTGRGSLTSAALFDLLWETLSEVLGSGATAALLRRAGKRAASREPELGELAIYRECLDHKYTVPRAWQEDWEDTPRALHELVRELRPLLVELTGTVMIRRLQHITEFQQRGIIAQDKEQA
jgi:hypothetical protein